MVPFCNNCITRFTRDKSHEGEVGSHVIESPGVPGGPGPSESGPSCIRGRPGAEVETRYRRTSWSVQYTYVLYSVQTLRSYIRQR